MKSVKVMVSQEINNAVFKNRYVKRLAKFVG